MNELEEILEKLQDDIKAAQRRCIGLRKTSSLAASIPDIRYVDKKLGRAYKFIADALSVFDKEPGE